ncbi:tRNA lysidine(34) synthetase TilS [Xanthomonas arboricola pv. corylina]|nr:tRNA lysidine(34) synthetase TilS [Xanthomonas arboricola pv. corylina]
MAGLLGWHDPAATAGWRATAVARRTRLALRATAAGARTPGGERIVLPQRAHSHRLKHLLQALDLPPWQRARLPILWADGQVLAAGDRIVSAALNDWLRAHGASLRWRDHDNAN